MTAVGDTTLWLHLAVSARPHAALTGGSRQLDLSLLRDLQSVIHLDAEISNRALELGVAKKKLNCSEILGPSIDQRGPGATASTASRVDGVISNWTAVNSQIKQQGRGYTLAFCRRTRIAQMSLTLNDAFWPTQLAFVPRLPETTVDGFVHGGLLVC
jgi:hypothetical protein